MSQLHQTIEEPGRKATWFELFFDLVFVAAIARLTEGLNTAANALNLLNFGFLFLVIWWCWLGHTFFASRFDRDQPVQRVFGFVLMICVLVMALGAEYAETLHQKAFAMGVIGFKAGMAVAYWLATRRQRGAELGRSYGSLYALQAGLWLGSLFLHPGLAWAALGLDMLSPFRVARYTHQLPPHPDHLPERFGLFTIILLGESVVSGIHGLDHGLSGLAISFALIGSLASLLIWWVYFGWLQAFRPRRVDRPQAGKKLRLWAYGHLPLYFGIVGVAQIASHSKLLAMGHLLVPILTSCALLIGLLMIAASNKV
ncbi:MAG: low temperature requirement protein A [Acidobacteria bacterium]|nr:low temperature requirement protein A [Acidobacteriota bacterium]MCB9398655.1 low temperature requirement protein A [Acidobacteriota bacterium]